MPLTIDPELATALAAFVGDNPPPPPAVGDWRVIRDNVSTAYATLGTLVTQHPEVTRKDYTATAADGTAIDLRWFAPPRALPGPAVVYAHGGGMVAGSVDMFDPYAADYAALSGVPLLSVEYRRAPEAQGTIPATDVFAALKWLTENAGKLGVDPSRVVLLGESAGAGLVAGTTILARDRGVDVAGQILIYPMLDDRTTTPDPLLEPVATWPHTSNETGWRTLLGDTFGSDSVSPVAAPARLTDFAGLPPAYIEVGELDIFRDETVAHAQALWGAGVPAELHVLPGLPHGFDQFAPTAAATLRAKGARVHAIRSLSSTTLEVKRS